MFYSVFSFKLASCPNCSFYVKRKFMYGDVCVCMNLQNGVLSNWDFILSSTLPRAQPEKKFNIFLHDVIYWENPDKFH